MDRPTYPAYRSASLPSPTQQPRAVTTPLAIPKKRDSAFMAPEGGPITPPMSPGASEDEEPMAIDPEPRYSGPGPSVPEAESVYLHPPADPRRASREMLQSEERMEVDSRRIPSSPRGASPKHLEDEQSHLERGGKLKLTDFEIKGTLGESPGVPRRDCTAT